ncbi:MAG: TetR/AcrR family transcriptional regulator [Bacteroidia bacterium]|nr:TetR/AcrR family transcriptional regulator [Bacteroidia bacterium]
MPSNTKKSVLYENTLKLFYEKGFKATTMREIADSMQFEAASIYNYIDSKQALLEELIFDIADQFHAGIENIQTSQLSLEDKLKAVINMYVRITAQNPYKAALLTSEWRNLNKEALIRFKKHRSEYEKQLKHIISAYLKEQNRDQMNPDIALHTFLGSMRWIYEWYISNESSINPIELQHQLTALILNGFSNTK